MSMTCVDVQEALETLGSEVGDEIARHAAVCPACLSHVRMLELLSSLEPAEADSRSVSRIVTALPVAPWQLRRVATWAPLAAGAALTWSGFSLLGGVPAGESFSALMGGAGDAVGWSLRSGIDALVAARGSSAALRSLVATGGTWLVLWLILTGVGGGWLAHSLARRQPGGRHS